MDEVLYVMPTADLNVLAAIVQAMCSNELALKGILQQNGATMDPSGIDEFRAQVFKEIERRRRHDK